MGKRKYNKGHRVEGIWVIGGIERSKLKNKIYNENKKLFMCPVQKRDSETIEKLRMFMNIGVRSHDFYENTYNTNIKIEFYNYKKWTRWIIYKI